jgi:glycosyltransferase involved in cell wall biosynthesis
MRLGVSEIFADAHPGMFRACWKAQLNGFIDRRELIVCAGFLSRLKNQLALVEALTGTGRILVLAGAEVPTHRGYARRLRSAAQHAGSSVLMTGSLSQEELASLFSAAKVVVLPSWFETCGMACLEGAAAGANVVITDRGYAREYFGDAAWYCDPGSVESIRKAVQEAFAAPRQLDFTKRIQRELTWEAAACMARETYAQVSRRGVR